MKRIITLVALALAAFSGPALADFPERSVTLHVPFNAGGPLDPAARALADKLAAKWDVSVVVENRGGASGQIGLAHALKLPADGYALILVSSGTHAANPSLVKDLRYDAEEFTPLTRLTALPLVLMVNAASAATTVDEFVEELKNKGSKPLFGYAAATTQIAALHLVAATGLEATAVPFAGQPEAVVDLLGGRVDFIYGYPSDAKPLVDDGKLKVLAIASQERSETFPDVPTYEEIGLPPLKPTTFVGLGAPAGMSGELATKINADVREAMQSPEIVELMARTGNIIATQTPAEFAQFLTEQRQAWAQALKEAGIEAK